MANKCDVAKKVMRLKLQLTDGAESATVLKTLHKLKDMDITVDILSETGIGKTVNSLRRHEQVGEFAKLLVKSWKSLIPKHSRSQTEDGDLLESESVKDKLMDKDRPSNGTLPTDDLNNNPIKSHNSLEEEHFQALDRNASSEKHSKERSRHGSHNDRHEKCHTENNQGSQQVLKSITYEDKNEGLSVFSIDKNSNQSNRKLEDCDVLFRSRSSEENYQKSRSDFKGKAQSSSDRRKVGSDEELRRKSKTSKSSKGSSESLSFDSSEKYSKTLELVNVTDDRSGGRPKSSEAQNKKRKKRSGGKQSVWEFAHESGCMESSKPKSKRAKTKHEDKQSDCDSAEPSMSFESYLNYDETVSKRRERSAVKKSKRAMREDGAPYMKTLKSTLISCAASDKQGSVMDLINIPLPADLLQCERSSNVEANNFEKKVEREPGFCDVPEEPAVFPGQRLNKKMQVYSGAKTTSLPTMMSLHQQCIRTLQNNINLLYETGGVPFEILEPVLERCTPEQLLRIEEYNPIYVGVTDHLWGKHCKREFKDSRLLEYESWKEMYVRLSEEREMKLQRLTKSIVSAHSNKPKGRQVKMAFIHTVAKPPRDVRIQQEIHGTAVQQPPQGRCSAKPPNNRLRPSCPEPSRSNTTSPASGNTQDLRKKSSATGPPEGVAPMMAKSLKAFKKQMGRR